MTATVLPIAHREAFALWSQLDAEFDRFHAAIAYIPTDEIRLQDDLRRYLCLRCAGFLEKVVYDCVTRYLEQTSGGPTLEFAKSLFTHAPNLNAKSLSALISRFGKSHGAQFEAFLTPTLRDSLNDLASVRNPIAHGAITGGQKLDPERYRRLCQEIYKWLTGELLTPSGTSTVFGANIATPIA